MNPSAELSALLNALIDRPDDRVEIERQITERFTEQRAVMVVDMSGFFQATQLQGAASVLLMIHRMRLLSEPVIESWGGIVIKSEADNLFAVFDGVDAAFTASSEIMRALSTANSSIPDGSELCASSGSRAAK